MGYYLYRHIRLDKNEPFYIGIGTKVKSNDYYVKYRRAFTNYRRNKIWLDIVSKTDYKVEIIFESNLRDTIELKEKEFIKLYGRKDLNTGCLSNLTDGGDGSTNINISEKHRKSSSSRMRTYNLNRQYDKNPNSTLVLNEETGIFYETIKEAYESSNYNFHISYFRTLINKNKIKFKNIRYEL